MEGGSVFVEMSAVSGASGYGVTARDLGRVTFSGCNVEDNQLGPFLVDNNILPTYSRDPTEMVEVVSQR